MVDEKGSNTQQTYVTTDEMMELIHTLNRGLELRDQSNKLLQQQIETNQRILHRRGKWVTYILILLGVGILALGSSAGGIMYNMDHAMKIVSTNMDEMRDFMETMSTQMTAMAGEIDEMEDGIQTMSSDVNSINTSVGYMSRDVNYMSLSVSGMAYDTRRMERNMDNMIPWK